MSVTLLVTDAVKLVRKNLDELDPAGSTQYGTEGADNESLDELIARNLPEAINAINLAAPSHLLDAAEVLDPGDSVDFSFESPVEDKVLEFQLRRNDLLRLVRFRASDSKVVVTDVIPEAGPEGRKQLNKYICGRPDRPRLVRLQGRHDGGPRFRYYSLAENPEEGTESEAVAVCEFVKEEKYNEESPATRYIVSQRLYQNIIDWLTATVLNTYGDQRARAFIQKASIFQ